ncbi:MAG TPA: TRAP transporter large permease subunit [Epsilonproteobacteria bacterium]|nr:TRAP transporter large permease subunit [Campylobacterota bacterium]
MRQIARYIDKISFGASTIASGAVLLLAFAVLLDIIAREVFGVGYSAIYELAWHFFDIIFLFGFAYALATDRHVRVDIFFARFSPTIKSLIRLNSLFLLAVPFLTFFLLDIWQLVAQSYIQQEVSSDPGGLKYRFIIKSVLFVGVMLLLIQALWLAFKHYRKLAKYRFKLFGFWACLGFVIWWAYQTDMTFFVHPVILLGVVAFGLLMLGVEVAFVFGGVALLFAGITYEVDIAVLEMLPYRTYGIMTNFTLLAVPLFIFMGLILEKSKIAEDLLLSLGRLFGVVRGGLAISVVLVGAILGASTGIVGASVVMMALIALPLMLKYNYSPQLASGTIAASGTLGQIIPPSVALIILGDQMHLNMRDLFQAAIIPGIILIGLYIAYILIFALADKRLAPAITLEQPYSEVFISALKAIIPPIGLILLVLGSILAGVASPTQSAALGVFGAIALAWWRGVLSFALLRYAMGETVMLTSIIFLILIGATAFSLVFSQLGGGDMVLGFFTQDTMNESIFVLIAMAIIFVLGFFVDFIEIIFIIVPILLPIIDALAIDPIWFAILIAMNIQASFLTPPFGFALFYLKGAAKDLISTGVIYRGVIPFIILQLVALGIVILFPNIIFLGR